MLGSACSPCCASAGCTLCTDDASQVVITYTLTGGTGGVSIPGLTPPWSISGCASDSFTTILDFSELPDCFVYRPNEFVLAKHFDGNRESGAEYFFPAVNINFGGAGSANDFSCEEHRFRLLPNEAAIVNVSRSWASSPPSFIDTYTDSNGGSSANALYLWRYRHRTEPQVVLSVQALSGSGAQLSPILERLADVRGQPYWRLAGVSVVAGGSGYTSPGGASVTSEIINGAGWIPPVALTIAGGVVTAASVVFVIPTGGCYPNWFSGFSERIVIRSRNEPVVYATASTNDDLSVTLSLHGSGETAYWSVGSVAVVDAGDGPFVDGQPVQFSTSSDTTTQQPAVAHLNCVNTEPPVTASTLVGVGATFTVNMSSNGGTPETWGVASVSVSSGSGYVDGAEVLFSDQYELVAASAVLQTAWIAPTTADLQAYGGEGAVLTAAFSPAYDSSADRTYYELTSISVSSGGSGYEVGDLVAISVTGNLGFEGGGVVDAVDENGSITAVSVVYSGYYAIDSGEPLRVVIYSDGEYAKPEVSGVTVTNGGKYYRQTLTVTEEEIPPLSCISFPDEWEAYVDEEAGTAVGGSYGIQLGPTFIEHGGTRRCNMGTVDVSIQ